MSAIRQPWLSNPEWCSRRVRGTTTSNPDTSRTSNIWITGVFALVVGGTGLLLRGQDLWSHPDLRNATFLIFPAIAVALFGWALLLNVRARQFGDTYFEMESLPFFVGQRLRGTIHSSGLRHGGPIRLRLNCVRRTKSRSHSHGVSSSGAKVAFEQLVWRDERFVPGQAQAATDSGIGVPVEFSSPLDAPTTNPTNPDDSILWNLEAWAAVRGADFLQNFEIILLYWAVWSWFSKSSAVFSRDGVAVRRSLFGVGAVKHIAYDDIRDITAPITSQWGQGSQAVPLYSISLITRSQGTITVAGSRRDPGEAGFVIKKMKEEMDKSQLAPTIH